MIPFEEALECVRSWSCQVNAMPPESVALQDAVNRVLAENAVAKDPYPRFDNSAVDGYAIGFPEDGVTHARLRVMGCTRAGDPPMTAPIERGTAVRIFTGAPVPPGTWAVLMQEDVVPDGEGHIVSIADASESQHIRRAGTDIAPGSTVAEEGSRTNAGHVALLATLGITKPTVRQQVPLAIITTGDELVPASGNPAPGQIRDSNGPMLYALAHRLGCDISPPTHVRDNQGDLEREVRSAQVRCRIVVITGGASVGEHDFASSIAARLGNVHFHGVAIRPGKPILFASLGETALFALPGNPAATFVGFHLFVRECVAGLLREHYEPRWIQVRLMAAHRTRERDDFLRARLHWGATPPEALVTQEQGSFALRSLAEAECLVRIPAGVEHQPGQLRQALLLLE